MKLADLENNKILIVGKGVEGLAVYDYLKMKLPDTVIDIVDKKDGMRYLNDQKNYDLAIKSPGVKPDEIKIPYTTPTNIFLSNLRGRVIGITGTKGKSTTSTLIYMMLKNQGLDVYLGGNIGVSPFSFIDKLNDDSWTVLELSSFQLQDIKTSPHIAVLLMVVPEHLNYHATLENYISAKRNILRFQTKDDYAVINRDYPASNESDMYTEGKVFTVSRERDSFDEGCFVKDGKIWLRIGGEAEVIDVNEILLPGKHNLENVCAAITAATLAGASVKSIVDVLKDFKGLDHRLEFVGEVERIKFFNDSLATIPEATIEAIESLIDVQTLICGGFDRGLDFTKLGEKIANSQIKTLILFPTTGKKIWDAVIKYTNHPPKKFDVESMNSAVGIAFAETKAGKICLMSPASASFSVFKNYKDRGEQFKKEVFKLKENESN